MSRRLSCARDLLRIAFVLALAFIPCSVTVSPRIACADEMTSDQAQMERRPVLVDPEVAHPGDDDQPTVVGGKRSLRTAAMPGNPSVPERGVRPTRREVVTHWFEVFRAFVGRLGQQLR
jgi:hypothetical protein